ncbi:MAG: hypothetical protein GHCLOJNM_00171 [bacterium]|nr:hypothetical protein [bacterium]
MASACGALSSATLQGCGLFRSAGEQEGVPRVEMAIFDGGFGMAWHQKVVERFVAHRAALGKPIRVDFWGDPRVIDKVRPRILRGAPPDISDAPLPFWKLAPAGALFSLNDWLDGPSFDQSNKTWRETFLRGALNPFTYEGQTCAIPLTFNAWILWYDKTLFEKHGWKLPSTFSEWETLCEEIKQAGIAPLAYQGKYPYYGDALYWSVFQRLSGIRKVERCQNFEPGAFLDPEAIEAARVVQSFTTRYFQEGAMTMSHTEAQLEFCNRRAAMIPCGVWLENEMRNAFPKDFRLSCFIIPRFEGGKGSERAVVAAGAQAFLAFRDGGRPEEGAELLRFMLSLENSREWVKTVSTVSSIEGATRREEIGQTLADVLTLVENAAFTFDNRLLDLFPTWRNEVWFPTLEDLLSGKIKPEAFARVAEKGLERIRRNPDVYKPQPRPLPQGAGVEEAL